MQFIIIKRLTMPQVAVFGWLHNKTPLPIHTHTQKQQHPNKNTKYSQYNSEKMLFTTKYTYSLYNLHTF